MLLSPRDNMDNFEKAANFLKQALDDEIEGSLLDASESLKSAAKVLESMFQSDVYHPHATYWREKMAEFRWRSDYLINHLIRVDLDVRAVTSCFYIFRLGLEMDEKNYKELALDIYTRGTTAAMEAKQMSTDRQSLARIEQLVQQAMIRAERLQAEILAKRMRFLYDDNIPKGKVDGKNLVLSGSNVLTKTEKEVLMVTSYINNIGCLPFMDIDLKEKFHFLVKYHDANGLIPLSPKQKELFGHWVRVSEMGAYDTLVAHDFPNYLTIKQTVISDCSFIASLSVAAAYEQNFKRRLITSSIFPRNAQYEPIYNATGKYMFKFHLNGIVRKVLIDDYLPVGKKGEMLCSYSTIPGEHWVSLVEKAYMKVMGGYDFPGSNSNIDLHILTGWIPERCDIKGRDATMDFDSLFKAAFQRIHSGDVLITVATGPLSKAEEAATGLVSTHAYAVIDIRVVKGKRVFLLKNPWSHFRWKGTFSDYDLRSWTQEIRNILNYNPVDARSVDNGVFWIDYPSILKYFDVFYMNWNPDIFLCTYCSHGKWSAGTGPAKDLYFVNENPQYFLDVLNNKVGAVWILLTRHITDISDFKDNKEYISVTVYDNHNGKRVYYPENPLMYGIRINSPHYLCKIILDQSGASKYTLVISQHEKTTTIYYTIRAYATFRFVLKEIQEEYEYEKKVETCGWTSSTAGGCRNHNTYWKNPRIVVDMHTQSDENNLLITLKAPVQFTIGMEVSEKRLPNQTESDTEIISMDTGNYRAGFVYLKLDGIRAGRYQIIPSTFNPNEIGPFILCVKSTCPISIGVLRF